MVNQKILIVDDNPLNLEILEEVCGDHFTCETASCGEEALVVAAMFHPDIVLLDIMMPDMDGYQVCKIMRENPMLNRAKIIMVSAKGMLAERLKGYTAGADDYIVKPFDDDELLAKIKVYARLKAEEETNKFKKDTVKLFLLEAKTPLDEIKAPLKVLIENVNLDVNERLTMLNQIQKSINGVERLLREVGSLSDLESGMWNNPFESIDLCELVKESINQIRPQASSRKIEIDYTVPEAAYALVNRDQILRVLAIVLKNAIQYNKIDGSGSVIVNITDSDGYHSVIIRDHGEGIEIPRLSNSRDDGTTLDHSHEYLNGPSLALAQHIVKVHNGAIEIESTKGQGTSVTIKFPIKLVG